MIKEISVSSVEELKNYKKKGYEINYHENSPTTMGLWRSDGENENFLKTASYALRKDGVVYKVVYEDLRVKLDRLYPPGTVVRALMSNSTGVVIDNEKLRDEPWEIHSGCSYAHRRAQDGYVFRKYEWAEIVKPIEEKPFSVDYQHLIDQELLFMKDSSGGFFRIYGLSEPNFLSGRGDMYGRITSNEDGIWDLYHKSTLTGYYIRIEGEASAPISTSTQPQLNTTDHGRVEESRGEESSDKESEQVSSSLEESRSGKQGNKLQLGVKESGFKFTRGSNSSGHRLNL